MMGNLVDVICQDFVGHEISLFLLIPTQCPQYFLACRGKMHVIHIVVAGFIEFKGK